MIARKLLDKVHFPGINEVFGPAISKHTRGIGCGICANVKSPPISSYHRWIQRRPPEVAVQPLGTDF